MDEVTGAIGEFLPPDLAKRVLTPFTVCARYYEPMDHILYLEEDVAYRADRVDRFLTLLWHPDEDRAIGVKLKGFRFVFERMREILHGQGIEVTVTGDEFVPLITAFEVAMTAGMGAAVMVGAEKKRLDEKYAKARELVKSARFDPRELMAAA